MKNKRYKEGRRDMEKGERMQEGWVVGWGDGEQER